jgi:hypothetical protein
MRPGVNWTLMHVSHVKAGSLVRPGCCLTQLQLLDVLQCVISAVKDFQGYPLLHDKLSETASKLFLCCITRVSCKLC